MRLKVIQLNMWHGVFLDRVIDFIKKENPDVVLLQEVTLGGGDQKELGRGDCYERLSESLEMESVFGPQWSCIGKVKYLKGQAIFTKRQIKWFGGYYYHGYLSIVKQIEAGVKPVGLMLSAGIEVDGRIIDFVNIHYLWSLHPEINKAQLAAVEELNNALSGKTELIVTGDFNVTDDSAVYNRLIEGGLIDDRPEMTANTLHPSIHKIKGSKKLAVDYIFHKGEKIRLKESRIPEVAISDHLPIVAIYEV